MMRPVEILLTFVNILAYLGVSVPRLRASRAARSSALLALPVAVGQTLTEGPRWQMVPAYVLSGIFLLYWLLRGSKKAGGRGNPTLLPVSVLGTLLGGLGMAVSAILPILFPVFRFPRPDGPYGIGTLTYHWVDSSRPEFFTADPKDRREVLVQIWYPAQDDPSAPRVPYVQDPGVLAPLARLLHLPGFIFGHLSHIATNAVQAAPMATAAARYPVLICSHGRGGYRQESTWLTELLVSHGYIVACIDHPYAASGVAFPDGHQTTIDPRMIDRKFVDSTIPYLAQDAIFTLGHLGALNRADPNGILTGQLDLQQTGIFGLSLGGETSAEACLLDQRFRACLVMDVWMPADVLKAGLSQPTMFLTRDAATIRKEGWSEADIQETLNTMRAVYERLPGQGYFVQIPGMFHQDFSDAPLLSPLTRILGLSGPIDPQLAHATTGAFALAFFDQHLKGQEQALLKSPSSQFPDVIFESH